MNRIIFLIVSSLILPSCQHMFPKLDEAGTAVRIVETVSEKCESIGIVSEDAGNAEFAEIRLRNAAGKKGANRLVVKSVTTRSEYDRTTKSHDTIYTASGTAYACN
jgi:hypothetical protein